jgi:hypothetical protein
MNFAESGQSVAESGSNPDMDPDQGFYDKENVVGLLSVLCVFLE